MCVLKKKKKKIQTNKKRTQKKGEKGRKSARHRATIGSIKITGLLGVEKVNYIVFTYVFVISISTLLFLIIGKERKMFNENYTYCIVF